MQHETDMAGKNLLSEGERFLIGHLDHFMMEEWENRFRKIKIVTVDRSKNFGRKASDEKHRAVMSEILNEPNNQRIKRDPLEKEMAKRLELDGWGLDREIFRVLQAERQLKRGRPRKEK